MGIIIEEINNSVMALSKMFGNNENATNEVVILAPILVKTLNDIKNGKIANQAKASLVNVEGELKNKRNKIEIIKDKDKDKDKETEKNMSNIHDEIIGGNARNQEENNDKERE